jgi:hypothetical protein
MKKLLLSFSYAALLSGMLFVSGCSDDNVLPDPSGESKFGWNGEDNMSEVPASTNFGFGNSSNLPSQVDLVSKFPPIGDQGNYGTCVAWAVAYNTKTAMSGMRRGLTTNQLLLIISLVQRICLPHCRIT